MKRRSASVVTTATAVFLFLAFAAQTALAIDAPKWVAALYVQAQKTVGLRWQPVPGATEFRVLRSTTPGSGHAQVAALPQPQFLDKEIEPGTTYYYVLQAVAGAEVSANSEERSVVIPGEKKVVEVLPPNFKDATLTQSVEFGKTLYKIGLFWEKSANPNVVAYNLYRSTAAGKDYKLLSSLSENSYVDAQVEEGATYYYVVSALDNQFVETPFSAERSVPVVKKEEVRKAKQKGPAMVTRGSVRLYSLDVKGYPVDLEMLPGGELAVACGHLQIFKSTAEGTEPVDIQSDTTDYRGLGTTNDGDLIAVSMSRGIRIFTAEGRLKQEIEPPPFNPETKVVFGDYSEFEKMPLFMDAAQAPDGRFYASDGNNHRILVFEENGKFAGTFHAGEKVGNIFNPTHVRISADGTRYFESYAASGYYIFDKDDNFLRLVGELGQQVGTFGKIQGMSFDGSGNVWVADMQNGNIQVFAPNGDYQFMVADETEKGNIQVALISGIAVGKKGEQVWAAESMSKRVVLLKILPKK